MKDSGNSLKKEDKMIRICLIVLTVTLLGGMFLGCGMIPSEQEQAVPAYIPTFSYTPPTQATPGSAGVTFLVLNVHVKYDETKAIPGNLWFTRKQFESLAKGMEQGLLNLLAARGITVRGPFDSYDNIPFPDKKGSDLIFIPAIEFSLDLQNENATRVSAIVDGSYGYNLTGKFVMSGKVNLVLRETITRELMWVKNIETTKIEVPYNVSTRLTTPGGSSIKAVAAYNAILNNVAKAIEKQYPTIMETAWKYFDPEEMRMVKKQCQELKEKK
jgi:hypothetical protein